MKILLADDHVLFREAMHYHLCELGMPVEILDAGNFQEALDIAGGNPDLGLALLDLNMPGSAGEAAVNDFCARFPDIRVVVISGVDQRDSIERVLNYGAMGFIPKTTAPSEMRNALNLVLDGGRYLPPQLLRKALQTEEMEVAGKAGEPILTSRQLEVLRHLASGCSSKEVSQAMNLAEGTIKVHVAAIFHALGVNKRMDAVLKAQRLGLIKV